ncbi:DNA repair protein RecO [Limibacter armeniacum]|uniref:DNA repair protein RecO n=1 Tax=Limibacter armeniacum TaxID=466084 RepID=UPI002FE6195D
MLIKTKGIVLGSIKYKESSIIVRIYTEALGLRSYIIHGVRSSKSKNNKAALYRPLTLLDMEVYERGNTEIQKVADARISRPFFSFQSNIYKSTILIFLTEVLSKLLKEEESNDALFTFLEQSLIAFDQIEAHFSNFHLQFLLKLPLHMGFGFSKASEMIEQLQAVRTEDKQIEGAINMLLDSSYTAAIPLNHKTRSTILDYLLKYFQLHMHNFGTVKSLAILQEVLSD